MADLNLRAVPAIGDKGLLTGLPHEIVALLGEGLPRGERPEVRLNIVLRLVIRGVSDLYFGFRRLPGILPLRGFRGGCCLGLCSIFRDSLLRSQCGRGERGQDRKRYSKSQQ